MSRRDEPNTYWTRRLLVEGFMKSTEREELFRKEVDHHWPQRPPDGCRCQEAESTSTKHQGEK